MDFKFETSFEILERTPSVLRTLLSDLPDDWVIHNEGPETWSPFDVVGHLLHGENTDWMPRLKKILSDDDKEFVPYDRFAQFEQSKGKTMSQLLDEFETARKENLVELRGMNLTEQHLTRTGIHPKFRVVTLSQLLSTWTVHDLTHLSQITRVMAKQYRSAIGPWIEYFRAVQ
jgi:hypothetical protein